MSIKFLFVLLVIFLTGCSKELPKCSDEKTLNLLRQIIVDEISMPELKYDPISQEDARAYVKFEFPRASSFDKGIKRYTCELKLVVTDDSKAYIKYDSQLDDKDEHIVSTFGLSSSDLSIIRRAIVDLLRKREISRRQEVIDSIKKLVGSGYGGYDSDNQCWMAEYDFLNYCMKVKKWNNIKINGFDRYYILLTGSVAGDAASGNGTEGMAGAFVIEDDHSSLKLIASNNKILIGSYGSPPDEWSFVKFGSDDYYGWTTGSGYFANGDGGDFFHIFVPYRGDIKDVGNFSTSKYVSNSFCRNGPCYTLHLNVDVQFDLLSVRNKFYPLNVIRNIVIESDGYKKEIERKSYVFHFDETEWRYVPSAEYIADSRRISEMDRSIQNFK